MPSDPQSHLHSSFQLHLADRPSDSLDTQMANATARRIHAALALKLRDGCSVCHGAMFDGNGQPIGTLLQADSMAACLEGHMYTDIPTPLCYGCAKARGIRC